MHTDAHAFIIWLSIMPLQTRDALNEEVTEQGLNVIQSVSFPTDQSLQPFVQKLQVSNWNEMNMFNVTMYELPGYPHTCSGVKWKDHFSKFL